MTIRQLLERATNMAKNEGAIDDGDENALLAFYDKAAEVANSRFTNEAGQRVVDGAACDELAEMMKME